MPIATPEVYAEMLDRAKAGKFAYPAINCSSSQTIVAAIQGFAEAESDGIVQFSWGGAEYASGQTVKDMVTGAVALAETAGRQLHALVHRARIGQQFLENAVDAAGVAAALGRLLGLDGVELLEDLDRYREVVVLELEDALRVMEEDVRVEHEGLHLGRYL